jgi:hypothetical protein
MERIVTDQEIYDLGFSSRAAYNRQMVAEGKKIERDAQRQANTVEYEGRRSDRFSGPTDPAVERAFTKSRMYANQQAAQAQTAPISTPVVPVVTAPVTPVEDFAEAKNAYHRYFKADNGYDKGKAFVDFGIALGEIPSDACGPTGGQAQADRISAILHDREISAFK